MVTKYRKWLQLCSTWPGQSGHIFIFNKVLRRVYAFLNFYLKTILFTNMAGADASITF